MLIHNIYIFRKVEQGNIFYPYVWAEESFELTGDDATALKDSLFMFVDLSEQIGFWCLVASAFFICAIIVITWMHKAPIEKVFAPRLSADAKYYTDYVMDENKMTDAAAVHNALFGEGTCALRIKMHKQIENIRPKYMHNHA